MKRLLGIFSVIALQLAFWGSTSISFEKPACCGLTHCASTLSCCQSGSQKTTPVPQSEASSYFNHFGQIISSTASVPIFVNSSVSYIKVGSIGSHAPPLFLLNSALLI
jgi:hypothetical protein